MPKNPLRRKPRKEGVLQKQQQRQNVRQSVVVNLAVPKTRRTRSGGGTNIARGVAIPSYNYRFQRTIQLPQPYTEVAAPSGRQTLESESQEKILGHTRRMAAELRTAHQRIDDLLKRQQAETETAEGQHAPNPVAPQLVEPTEQEPLTATAEQITPPVIEEVSPLKTPSRPRGRPPFTEEQKSMAEAEREQRKMEGKFKERKEREEAKLQPKLVLAEEKSAREAEKYKDLESASAFGGRSRPSFIEQIQGGISLKKSARNPPPSEASSLLSSITTQLGKMKKSPPSTTSSAPTAVVAPFGRFNEAMLDNPFAKERKRIEEEESWY